MADEAAQEANINQTQTNNDVSNDSNVDSSHTFKGCQQNLSFNRLLKTLKNLILCSYNI